MEIGAGSVPKLICPQRVV